MRNEDTALRQRIEAIRAAVGPGVTLVAATKTVPPECINEAIRCGVRVIGENRVQELLEKYDAIDRRQRAGAFHWTASDEQGQIHRRQGGYDSVARQPAAGARDRKALRRARADDGTVWVEVNLEGEAAKGGVPYDETEAFVDSLAAFPHIAVRGLRPVPPKCGENAKKLGYFQKIYQKFIDIRGKKVDNSFMDILSAGMSGDYEQAVACGSNMVRVGRAIFGERT